MKLFSKLFGSYVIIFLLFIIFFMAFSYKTINRNYLKTSSHYLKEFDQIIMSQIMDKILLENYHELDDYVKSLQTSIRITFINPQGMVIADSDNQPQDMDDHSQRPEILEAGKNGTGVKWRFSDTMGRKMLYYAHKLEHDGETLGYLRLSFFDYQIEKLRSGLLEDVSQLLVIGLLAALLVTFLLSKHFLVPVQRLAKASRNIREGDFTIRLRPQTRDEMEELSISFNSMLDHIEKLINETRSQKEALRKIIESLTDLLWVIDVKSEKISLSNSAFQSLFNLDDAEGMYYWEVIRSLEINNFIKESLQKRQSEKRNVNLFNKEFIISGTYLWETNSLIFLMNDITAFKQLEQVKRDIVANASHELRTPLVSIKGYTELLSERLKGDDQRIVKILQRNINRLSSLVNDILILSHLEKISKADLALTNVSQLMDNICLLYKLRLEEKNLHLVKDYQAGIMAYIDAYRFEQMVNNLLDNAVKYTKEGSITLSVSLVDNELIFECSDTGIGIPEDLISRVFERFFVVDKSRSRKLGGTGLGLSIVKHIVNLHQGKIRLESTIGKGSRFIVRLPADR